MRVLTAAASVAALSTAAFATALSLTPFPAEVEDRRYTITGWHSPGVRKGTNNRQRANTAKRKNARKAQTAARRNNRK